MLRSDLPSPECSPRTHALRTRIRCAAQVDVSPPEPEQLGLAQPGRSPQRGSTHAGAPGPSASPVDRARSGIAAITASSSAASGTADPGSASPSRRRRGRAARATGLADDPSALTASAKTECRNVMTLRTVFGASPRSSIARASRSTSSRVTVSTRRLPMRRRDMDALHRLAVLPIRQPRALDGEALAQRVGDLVDGRAAVRRRAGRATSLSASISRRSARSASARVRPSGLAARADLADRRLTRRPSGDANARSRRPISRRAARCREVASWPP